jgi:hypothetical protein
LMPGLAWTTIFLYVLLHIARIAGACQRVQLLVQRKFHKHFAWAGSKLPSYRLARIIGLRYKPVLPIFFLLLRGDLTVLSRLFLNS